MADPTIGMLAITSLTPWARNARTHSKKQVRQIAESIETFGFTNPVLVDGENVILAGHGRVEAAKLLAMASVPCVRLDSMTPEQKRAYVLADNKLALNAGWDEELLAGELEELMSSDLDFDIGVTGFSIPEIDSLIEGISLEEEGNPEEDVVPADTDVAARCRVGDLWQLGPHRLICGDALDGAVVDLLMGEERARMVFADPPYNVPIDGHVGGSGKIKHREFAMASGEMSCSEFAEFLRKSFANLARASLDGSIHYVCMDWRDMQEINAAGDAVYSELKM